MHLDPSTLPPVLELEDAGGTIRLVPDDAVPITEIDYQIDAVRMSKADSGITLDYATDPTALSIAGAYVEQFSHRIGYAKPQVDSLTKPEQVFVKTWAEVPAPDQTDQIWFLFEYTPPSVMTTTITYEVDVSWTERDETIPGSPVDTPMSQTFTISQTVNYATETNVAKFKEYYPDPPPLP